MSKFKVGDIIIGQNFIFNLSYNGLEGEVIAAEKIRRTRKRNTNEIDNVLSYLILWSNNNMTAQKEFNLRKKPPKEKTSTWEEVEKISGWNPTKTLVYV